MALPSNPLYVAIYDALLAHRLAELMRAEEQGNRPAIEADQRGQGQSGRHAPFFDPPSLSTPLNTVATR